MILKSKADSTKKLAFGRGRTRGVTPTQRDAKGPLRFTKRLLNFMDSAEYGRMHALETHYWWFLGRRRLVATLLAATREKRQWENPTLVDIGCGTGANLPMLREATGPGGRVFGFDFSDLALQFARGQSEIQGDDRVNLAQADALRLPIADGSAHLVTMLDVLEHLRDDDLALREVHRILQPGGALLLTVPAYQHLWSAHDEALHHFRRYEKNQLAGVLKGAGFQIWRLSFAMSLMPPIAWAWRRFVLPFAARRPQNAIRHSQGAVLPPVPPFINSLLANYVAAEGQIIRKKPLKFGTTLVAIALRD